jgi:diguanylate cyclase (GGDEF)-like protein
VLALAVLLAAVAAVAYLEKIMAGTFDVQLVYFLIALSASLLLSRSIAITVAAAMAVVNAGISGDQGAALAVNLVTHFLIYGYAALLTSNWENERRRLMKMSRIDDLTGLHNLRALREQLPVWLGPAVRTRRPMAILMVDVDGFKSVNDRLGHGVGNELLKEIASLLRFSVRVGDEPFRFGGDEFVLLLADADGPGATVVASRIQEMYDSMGQTLRGTNVKITLSFGLAVFPDDGSTSEELLSHADEALYRAKRSGGGAIARYERPAAA